MTVLHMHTPDGGFLAGDTETGLTAYAYPTSTHATRAKRHPDAVARVMLDSEPQRPTVGWLATSLAARDTQWLAQLRAAKMED